MKKILMSIMTLVSLCSTAYTHAEIYDDNNCGFCCNNESNGNFYAEIFSGANFLQTEKSGGIKSTYKPGYIVSGSLGYQWCNGLRLEAEYAFRRNSIRKVHFFGRSFTLSGHFQSSSYMANALWDLPLSSWGCECWNIHPFIGGGIGYDFQQVHAKNGGLILNQHKKNFAWQIIAGLGYPIFCHADLSLEYKFHKGGFKHLYNHSIGLGLLYRFGG